ncbi:MAG: hypothetical protein RDU14_04450 [Melioribacteraceae bacterium]|nr:hypothetical protein [Melioribacteraceae bacterium]
MLRITLESQNQFNNITPQNKDELSFELKVVTEGLFPEVRLSYTSNDSKKRFKVPQPKNLSEHKENIFR